MLLADEFGSAAEMIQRLRSPVIAQLYRNDKRARQHWYRRSQDQNSADEP
jgi:hypothetical protein